MSDWHHMGDFSFTYEIHSLVWVFYTCHINTQDRDKRQNFSSDLNMIEAHKCIHGITTVTYRVALKCANKNPKLMARIMSYILRYSYKYLFYAWIYGF